VSALPPPERIHVEAGHDPAVHGWLHWPAGEAAAGIVLAHGAGSSGEAPLLVALAGALAARGTAVLRCDLPFRQARATGPPGPGDAARDRAGLRAAVLALRDRTRGAVALGGHSYGGRQATLLLAEEPHLAPALLLAAYPLHPPGRPDRSRTAHFPRLTTPALFVHGTRDPFGTEAELQAALALIPARHALLIAEGAGHDLLGGRRAAADQRALADRVAGAWARFLAGPPPA
jgi:predicted alpha/beta-hydrolase family hydrolase